mmetsp:Transcript_26156/g.55633  ORF Transcript_26156/g.55633 Transcript_26156/m.55633 type:complete len:122 (-) Transcript_26156:2503-2868(-)
MLRARLLSYYLPMHKLLGSKQENGNIVFQYLPGWPVLKGALLSCPVEDMMLVENHGIQNSSAKCLFNDSKCLKCHCIRWRRVPTLLYHKMGKKLKEILPNNLSFALAILELSSFLAFFPML